MGMVMITVTVMAAVIVMAMGMGMGKWTLVVGLAMFILVVEILQPCTEYTQAWEQRRR